ncbi:bcl-2-like protein 1 [Callorhinchus milii]|uniref:BCL2 like 2 n=1 Tax=Callorhinchus milii TaxID=7868 RepID=A0A4W3JU32_CALMI|nr:bcl-2-like protein 1 [Callorhinchus milii]|eukprot:gi/632973825/ref/XP_007903343.1/ PREDICTED: bcl-2-like protein 1 [Callorhinchus milii]
MALSSRALVEDFLGYKLRQRGHCWPPSEAQAQAAGPGSAGPEEEEEAERVRVALREAAEEFELRYRRAFRGLAAQLHVTPDTAYQRFEQVVGELFRDGVNWGRIVAFFCFGGALSAESLDKEMAPLVPRIASWMIIYMESNLQPWILQHGGWEAFVALYGNNAAARSRHIQETVTWLMTLVAVGAGLAIAVFLARRR